MRLRDGDTLGDIVRFAGQGPPRGRCRAGAQRQQATDLVFRQSVEERSPLVVMYRP